MKGDRASSLSAWRVKPEGNKQEIIATDPFAQRSRRIVSRFARRCLRLIERHARIVARATGPPDFKNSIELSGVTRC